MKHRSIDYDVRDKDNSLPHIKAKVKNELKNSMLKTLKPNPMHSLKKKTLKSKFIVKI